MRDSTYRVIEDFAKGIQKEIDEGAMKEPIVDRLIELAVVLSFKRFPNNLEYGVKLFEYSANASVKKALTIFGLDAEINKLKSFIEG